MVPTSKIESVESTSAIHCVNKSIRPRQPIGVLLADLTEPSTIHAKNVRVLYFFWTRTTFDVHPLTDSSMILCFFINSVCSRIVANEVVDVGTELNGSTKVVQYQHDVR